MKVFSLIFGAFFVTWAFLWCVTPSGSADAAVSGQDVTTVATPAAEDLDLEALIPLVKEAKDAEDLEKKINEPDGINNLDLNSDGQVDFIKVTEFGNKDAYGFSLTAFPAEGEEQEVATIELQREDTKAMVQVSGNQHIYGPGYHRQSYFDATDFILLAWLMAPHPPYFSPWGWGYYPSYYRPYYYRPAHVYRSYSSSYRNSFWSRQPSSSYGVRTISTPVKTGLSSPNATKVANTGITKSLANPTATQKSFQARAATKAVKSGGFGRSSATANSTSSARGSSSRGFGGSGK